MNGVHEDEGTDDTWSVEYGNADPSAYLRALDRVLSLAVSDLPVPDVATEHAA